MSNQIGNSLNGNGRNRFAGGLDNKFGAYPNGNLAPSAFIMPQKSGSISTYTLSFSNIQPNVNLIPARNLEASTTSTITVTNAQLDQIVSAVANGTATISVVNAILAGAATLQANSVLQITSNANIGAIFSVTANANGEITVSSNLTALAFMNAEAGGPPPLSPEGLANAVWSSLAADNNEPNTMGEKLNDAGSAGNPWAANLVDNNTPNTFGWFVQKLLTVAKFLGLR